MPRVAPVVSLLLLGALPASAIVAGEVPLNDVRNPRNARFEGRLIQFVADSRRLPLSGEPPAWGPRSEVRWMIGEMGVPDPSARAAPTPSQWLGAEGATWTLDGRPREPREERKEFKLGNGMTASMAATYIPWVAEPGRHVLVASTQDDRCVTYTDALRVLLLVERATFDDGARRFGSFPRRFRKSIDDLHTLFEAAVHPSAPKGVVDRFRIADGVVYRRADGPERIGFAEHPAADVAVACDQGGPRAGVFLAQHAVGWAATNPGTEGDLWSAQGEQTLWRDLLRLRGVPDYARYAAAPGALPGRSDAGLPLPQRIAADLMASVAQAPRLTELTTLLLNANAGISAVGDPDDAADGRFGRTWRWIAPRLDIVVSDGGAPAAGATVRWWRSMPMPTLPLATPQGVAEGRAPDGEATADATGKISILGDFLGSREKAVSQRGLWLLVEVERAGAKRFEIVYGLDLNLSYARGEKFFTTVRFDLASMLVPSAPVPAAR